MLILAAESAISGLVGPIKKNESIIAEDTDPSTFVISAAALESLSPEDQAAAAEGMAKINAMNDLGKESIKFINKT